MGPTRQDQDGQPVPAAAMAKKGGKEEHKEATPD